MTRSVGCTAYLLCALALTATAIAPAHAFADDSPQEKLVFLRPTVSLVDFDDVLAVQTEFAADEETSVDEIDPPLTDELRTDGLPTEELPEDAVPLGDDIYYEYVENGYTWQVAPSGIIYRSYLAGPHEPRISISPFFSSNHSYWDATVGGRGGVFRYGDRHPLHPQGWQLDVYGAAVVRMDAENHQDLDATDFVFGFPLTYGIANWQFKMGYAHLSSHLGDEYAIRHPGALDDRINYVRDGIVWGTSWFPTAACRVYGELDWAFHNSDGSEPIHFQFGNELSHPGPTGMHGSPSSPSTAACGKRSATAATSPPKPAGSGAATPARSSASAATTTRANQASPSSTTSPKNKSAWASGTIFNLLLT